MTHRNPHGFTLIELMVSVAIIGLLSSVALPSYQRTLLRARAAERDTILESLSRAVNDIIMQQQRVPGSDCVPGERCVMSAEQNPPGDPGTTKRKFVWTLPAWKDLPMVVAGDAYYSYQFDAVDAHGDGKDVSLIVQAWGDLDGDGVQTNKVLTFAGVGYAFNLLSEVPARGFDEGTF